MLIVPTQPLANQSLQAQLNNQACTIDIYQTMFGLFMDVYVGETAIISGVICQNGNRIVRSLYLGFSGDLSWFDTQGTSDPVYTGLGSRFQLLYLAPSDLPAGQG